MNVFKDLVLFFSQSPARRGFEVGNVPLRVFPLKVQSVHLALVLFNFQPLGKRVVGLDDGELFHVQEILLKISQNVKFGVKAFPLFLRWVFLD